MSEPHPSPPRLFDSLDADMVRYRALSGLAVVGLVLGIASALDLLVPMFWIMSVLGAVVSGLALWRIRRNAATLTGRRLAQCGLLLSIAFGVAAAVDGFVYRRLFRQEARQFAATWFDYLLYQKPPAPQKSLELTRPPAFRQPLDDRLWDFYRRSARRRDELETYVNSPLVRTLLALGPKAEVRYYSSLHEDLGGEGETIDLIYAVSYDAPEGKTTFFVDLELKRIKVEGGRASWQLSHADVANPQDR
jgi:hypothetical protein